MMLQQSGFAVVPGLLDEREIDDIAHQLERSGILHAGTRRLLDEPWCRELREKLARDGRISKFLPQDARAVQCNYFTKSPAQNWLVALHQDLSIPVSERVN